MKLGMSVTMVERMFDSGLAAGCFSYVGITGERMTACQEYVDFASKMLTDVRRADEFAWCDFDEEFLNMRHFFGAVEVVH